MSQPKNNKMEMEGCRFFRRSMISPSPSQSSQPSPLPSILRRTSNPNTITMSLTPDQARALWQAGGFALLQGLPEGSETGMDGT
jgi:hypothetical protein